MERPKGQRIGLWAISVGLISFLLWNYMLSGTFEAQTKAEEQLAKVEKEIAKETVLMNNLVRFRKEVKELDELLKLALKRLPQKREIPSMLETISGLARNAGLEVKRFAPQADINKRYYAEVPIDIEMKGTFHKVVTFFDEVSRMPRIVNIKELTIDRPSGYSGNEAVEIEIKGILRTFRYLEPSERPKNEEDEESDDPNGGGKPAAKNKKA